MGNSASISDLHPKYMLKKQYFQAFFKKNFNQALYTAT